MEDTAAATAMAAGRGAGGRPDAPAAATTSPAAPPAGKEGKGTGAGGDSSNDTAEITVKRPDGGRGPGGLVAVGLDVGTGWVKVSALGRTAMFPSLYSCTYAMGSGDEDVIKGAGEKGRPKAVLRDAVGEAATAMAAGRSAILIRPVKHGVPHDGRGYSRLAAEAMRAVGIDDPGRAVICAGVPYDARADRERIRKLVAAAVRPADCMVLPQAYGTLKACGREAGTVVNIGHGTTEIMRVGPEGMYGVSIQKASEFVLQQLAQRGGWTGRDSYTEYDKVLAGDPKMTARLVELLAVHIADEVQQFGVGTSGEAPEIILSGGGSRMPGMAEALSKALGGAIAVRMIDEPSYSNAMGLELVASGRFQEVQKKLEKAKEAAASKAGGPADGAGGGGAGGSSSRRRDDGAARGGGAPAQAAGTSEASGRGAPEQHAHSQPTANAGATGRGQAG